MTRAEVEAHVNHIYGPHWRAATEAERTHPLEGIIYDPSYTDPLWPHQPIQPIIDNMMKG